jgi:hypothetical protein
MQGLGAVIRGRGSLEKNGLAVCSLKADLVIPMLSIGGTIHLSASDLVGHLNCRYLTSLDLSVARGELEKPTLWDPVLEVLAERGAIHERNYLDYVQSQGIPIVRIGGTGVDATLVAQTIDAMRAGASIIALDPNELLFAGLDLRSSRTSAAFALRPSSSR